jgi:hypothetical protein
MLLGLIFKHPLEPVSLLAQAIRQIRWFSWMDKALLRSSRARAGWLTKDWSGGDDNDPEKRRMPYHGKANSANLCCNSVPAKRFKMIATTVGQRADDPTKAQLRMRGNRSERPTGKSGSSQGFEFPRSYIVIISKQRGIEKRNDHAQHRHLNADQPRIVAAGTGNEFGPFINAPGESGRLCAC